ncbi:hypothetical protein WMY93_032033 [Mugilogobius chulae]|uniref:RGS domain-containing protein n=1 Tax=Mugilogobius chulae TaxID=88201 RepID=A0AAW0MGK3_9GOBI
MRDTQKQDNTMAFTETLTELSTDSKDIKRKGWKNRITLLLKKNTRLIKNKPCRPSSADALHWGQSLEQLLAHKYGKAAFFVFLKSEFCEENLEFWSKCEDYRTLSCEKEQKTTANSIYEEFVRSEAPKEINLDYLTRNAITAGLSNPDPELFIQAERKVYSLMENNAYPRFLQSQLYKDLCSTAAGKNKRSKS